MLKQEYNKLCRSFQGGGGFTAVSGWDPLEYPSKKPLNEPLEDGPDPNAYINSMLGNLISYNDKGAAVINPNITSSGRNVSRLERLFYSIEPDADFSQFFSFLANTAEAESYSGEVTNSSISSATGDFHILTGNAKNGGTSSFDTGKQRIRNLKKKYGDYLSGDPEVISALDKIISAKSPKDLSREEQAMFVFVDLKMKSNNLKDFLSGKISDSDLYSREWVTEGSENHSKSGILENWRNAGLRLSSNGDRVGAAEKYFNIQVREPDQEPIDITDEVGRIKFDQRQKLNNLSPSYRAGGKLSNLEVNGSISLQNVRNKNKLF